MTTDSALVLAQALGDEGDEALYRGAWPVAFEKYAAASKQCADALQTSNQATKAILEKLLSRYSEKAQQIQEYMNTPTVDEGTLADSLNLSGWPSTTDSFMPSSAQLHGDDSTTETIEAPPTQNSAGTFGMIYKGVETFISKYIYYPAVPAPNSPTDARVFCLAAQLVDLLAVDLDSSFILLPDGPNINPEDLGQRVTLSDSSDTKTNTDNPTPLTDSNVESLLEEIKNLKAANQTLKQSNLKLQEQCLRMPAVHSLMQENVHLRKSFFNFRKQVTTLASQYPQGLQGFGPDSPRPPAQSRASDRVHALEENIRLLHERLEAKDAQIKELEDYKVKWEKLKHDARQKRKLKEGASDAANNSSGLWGSDYVLS